MAASDGSVCRLRVATCHRGASSSGGFEFLYSFDNRIGFPSFTDLIGLHADQYELGCHYMSALSSSCAPPVGSLPDP